MCELLGKIGEHSDGLITISGGGRIKGRGVKGGEGDGGGGRRGGRGLERGMEEDTARQDGGKGRGNAIGRH